MPGIRAISSALAVAGCAAALTACGGDDGGPIPQEDGEQLIDQLDQIDDLVQQGQCEAAQQVAVEFASGVNELPQEVDGELRDQLVRASGNLESLTQDTNQCTPPTGATGDTGEIPPETTEEPPAPDETTEPPTTEDEPRPEEEEDDGEDEGGGPPEDTPGQGNPGGGNEGGGNEGGGSIGGDESSGGIGSGG